MKSFVSQNYFINYIKIILCNRGKFVVLSIRFVIVCVYISFQERSYILYDRFLKDRFYHNFLNTVGTQDETTDTLEKVQV